MTATTWRDHKRYLWAIALTMSLLPSLAIGLRAATGSGLWLWLWLGPMVILGVVPVCVRPSRGAFLYRLER